MDLELKPNFDMNTLPILVEGLDSHIETGPNIVGISDASFGIRRITDRNLRGLKTRLNNKMLAGNFYEAILKRPRVLKLLLRYMLAKFEGNPQYDPNLTYEEICNKEDYCEINIGFDDPKLRKLTEEEYENGDYDGYLIRLHPDIFTNLYTIEVKTTLLSYYMWKNNELEPYQYLQENFYVGYYGHNIGFLHKLNMNAFTSEIALEIKRKDIGYWERLWKQSGYFIPVYFSQQYYDIVLRRLEAMFKAIETKDLYQPCPGFAAWECNDCLSLDVCKNPIVKKSSGTIIKCSHCNKKVESHPKSGNYNYFIRNGKDYCKEEACVKAVVGAWRHDDD